MWCHEKVRKVGILGGTFNPIHMGHLLIAESAREHLELERVIILPSGCSYMKSNIGMPDTKLRLAMAELAVADNPFFTVSDMEIKRGGDTYTCETIEQFHAEYPGAELIFIVGADTLFTMEMWKEPERIFQKAVIAAAVRNEANILEMQKQKNYLTEKYRADIRLLPVESIGISSSEIREKAGAGKSIRYMVPEAVREYIMRHKIYIKHED